MKKQRRCGMQEAAGAIKRSLGKTDFEKTCISSYFVDKISII